MKKNKGRKKQTENKSIRKTSETRKRRRFFSLMDYRIGRVLVFATMLCGVSVLCLFLSSTVLFSIKDISVQGDEVYEPGFIIEQSGTKLGHNLFLLDAKQVGEKLENELPNVDEVTVTKKFPGKVIINVKQAVKAVDVEVDGKFVSISCKGKVLEVSDVHDDNLILLQGVELESFEVGDIVAFADKSVGTKVFDIIAQMGKNNLNKVTGINFNSGYNLIVSYDNRVEIDFGFYENMDYKIRTAAEIINNKLGAKEAGVLDLSEVSKENRSYFTSES